ncbi:MAG: hypothetical protein QM775_23740 [Pirellulales bacterium]
MTWYRVVTYPIIAALLLFMVYVGLTTGHPEGRKQIKVIVEIGQLQTGVQAYHEKYGDYFPCLAEPDVDAHKVRFLTHLAKVFPESKYGLTTADFDKLNSHVQTGFKDQETAYNFRDAAGRLRPLDLATLDAAESLVFWLGGFPTPINPQSNEPVANRRIFGLHRDADDPLRRDAKAAEARDPLRFRTDPFYQFDETRLVDNDADGWWEYAAIYMPGSDLPAPFVYFDARSYLASSAPETLGTLRYPTEQRLAEQWGYVVPYASSYTAAGHAVAWHNPQSFQIISGGLENAYDAGTSTFVRRVIVVPQSHSYLVNGPGELESVAVEVQDNLTNLTSNTLEGWRQAAGS